MEMEIFSGHSSRARAQGPARLDGAAEWAISHLAVSRCRYVCTYRAAPGQRNKKAKGAEARTPGRIINPAVRWLIATRSKKERKERDEGRPAALIVCTYIHTLTKPVRALPTLERCDERPRLSDYQAAVPGSINGDCCVDT